MATRHYCDRCQGELKILKTYSLEYKSNREDMLSMDLCDPCIHEVLQFINTPPTRVAEK